MYTLSSRNQIVPDQVIFESLRKPGSGRTEFANFQIGDAGFANWWGNAVELSFARMPRNRTVKR